jgi:hypothetical protein
MESIVREIPGAHLIRINPGSPEIPGDLISSIGIPVGTEAVAYLAELLEGDRREGEVEWKKEAEELERAHLEEREGVDRSTLKVRNFPWREVLDSLRE